ncbi:tol-pal system protein YbgF [Frigidibacter sp. ROC022]|uniref:tol-pal system protein YbgF n=1 Tax=Frigidibacter sp. ROC022 TaxID=2971796 RepID=UPI00215B1B92|nr:tol-pal system protein YbgF [Frigidibacter sp. ROC022]MCR8725142.1 tol-pal system protein YbgF [Frigidibacter sp. ROC022]
MLRAALLSLALVLPAPVLAQSAESLADIRTELGGLGAEMARLRAELVAGSGGGSGIVAGSALDRMNAMEEELSRLTAKTEQLEIRIQKIVADGTNRIGDLEFRLCELEPNCDISTLGTTPPLGGEEAGAGPVVAPQPEAGAELAIGEKSDFDRAKEAFDSGSFRSAADLFASFAETYPGSPLGGEASFYRGEALMALGETSRAARAWLESFQNAPAGPHAAEALLKLGLALNTLGQRQESCVTLGEVPNRYPGTDAANQAVQARTTMGCE